MICIHSFDFNEDESITSKMFALSAGGFGSSIPVENDIINVTINMDGVVQSLELINENK